MGRKGRKTYAPAILNILPKFDTVGELVGVELGRLLGSKGSKVGTAILGGG